MSELSGLKWINRFPGSNKTTDLTLSFRLALDDFIAALKAAGALVHINSTFRPPERAYLMHYAWKIAREKFDPTVVPKMVGVDIDWVHKLPNGEADFVRSKTTAEAMVGSAGYNMVHRAALTSRHTEKRAVDMTISWNGSLEVKKKDGTLVKIGSIPKDGMNLELHSVGVSYGVVKLLSDAPHWSDDGH